MLQLANPALGTAINDVIVADGAAWFTDSFHPHLYRVPIGADGSIGTPSTLVVSGPAAHLSGDFNMNGIAAIPNGKTLIVAHSGDGALYTVNPITGASAAIAGADVPDVDGILYRETRISSRSGESEWDRWALVAACRGQIIRQPTGPGVHASFDRNGPPRSVDAALGHAALRPQ